MTQLTPYDYEARVRALAERTELPDGETWRPDQPESGHPPMLIGEFVNRGFGTTEWGQREIATLRDTDGALWNVWINSTVLIEEWAAQAAVFGDLVAVRFDGM